MSVAIAVFRYSIFLPLMCFLAKSDSKAQLLFPCKYVPSNFRQSSFLANEQHLVKQTQYGIHYDLKYSLYIFFSYNTCRQIDNIHEIWYWPHYYSMHLHCQQHYLDPCLVIIMWSSCLLFFVFVFVVFCFVLFPPVLASFFCPGILAVGSIGQSVAFVDLRFGEFTPENSAILGWKWEIGSITLGVIWIYHVLHHLIWSRLTLYERHHHSEWNWMGFSS